MEYAKTLVPASVIKRVSSVGLSLTQRVLPITHPRPFKILTHDRCQKRGVMASSLDDLVQKARITLLLTCQFLTLVLDEDGTMVETDAFFQSLPDNAQLMVLEKGEEWTQAMPSVKRSQKNGVAKLSFDLYKLNPKDFIGCLTVKARLYGMYTLSYDIKCMRAKHVLILFLRSLAYVVNVAGHVLLCGSSSVLQYLRED